MLDERTADDPAASPDGESPGLRARKKRRTREAIVAAALELFAEHGFRQTTIPAIARAADVSPRTVSGYFPQKEELLFPEHEEAFADLAARFDDPTRETSAVAALRDWIADSIATKDERRREEVLRRRIIDADEGLIAHERGLLGEAEAMLARAIARDVERAAGGPVDEAPSRMAAAAMVAVLLQIGRDGEAHRCAADDDLPPDERRANALEAIDAATTFVTAGLVALVPGLDAG